MLVDNLEELKLRPERLRYIYIYMLPNYGPNNSIWIAGVQTTLVGGSGIEAISPDDIKKVQENAKIVK